MLSFLANNSIDVVFALGASRPGGASLLELEKDIVKNMMDQLKLLDVKYGVLEYDQNARVILELGTDSTQVKNALEGMSWRSDATGLANVRLVFSLLSAKFDREGFFKLGRGGGSNL